MMITSTECVENLIIVIVYYLKMLEYAT